MSAQNPLMTARFVKGNVTSPCPGCGGSLSTFEARASGGSPYGHVFVPPTNAGGGHIIYQLLKCAGCGRAGLAEIHSLSADASAGRLVDFFPFVPRSAPLPKETPDDLRAEFREAELCGAIHAWRAASAMIRSVLEKTLLANGYTRKDGALDKRIDAAAADGILGEPRRQRVHQDIRVLGNDILHDPWRVVTQDEYEVAHHYALRILEDLYDNREGVRKHLQAKGRLPADPPS